MQATGTVQRRSVRAPHTTSAIANGRRTRNGIGTAAQVPSRPATWVRTAIQSAHAQGMIAAEVATTMAVAPMAIARLRHSRRTANQMSPIPGETLVSRISAQAAGQRKPSTMATARRSEMLPPASSADASTTPTRNRRGPVRNRTASSRIAVHTPTNASHGRCCSGDTSCRNAGE